MYWFEPRNYGIMCTKEKVTVNGDTNNMSRIGIIDADLLDNGTRHPNIALMKISGYYKEQGNTVELIYKDYIDAHKYDKLFMSKVFSYTTVPQWVLKLPNLEIGGTGFYGDCAPNLSAEIEHHMPDYHLYDDWVEDQINSGKEVKNYNDYTNFSIGFITRGCFRKCSFCINKKYDSVFRHSHIEEFLDETRPCIYLWDDNILGFSKWEEVFDELDATGKPYQFRQGVDLRLMTDRKAMRLNKAKWHGDIIFAFDHVEDRDLISEKVQIWKRHSTKVCKMYVLSGYDSQDAQDIKNVFERIKILMYYGSLPYIMRYEEYKNSEFKGMYTQLARWCNQPRFFKKKSFRQYCEANQEYQYHGEMDKYCASYRAMVDFEEKYPEIATEYFDLKFEYESIYIEQYGYGRKYANKTSCKECKRKYKTWEDFISSNNNDADVIRLYFTKELDLQCTSYKNAECNNCKSYVKKLLRFITSIDKAELIYIIADSNDKEKINSEFLFTMENPIDLIKKIVSFMYLQTDFIYGKDELKYEITKMQKGLSDKNINNILRLAAQSDLIMYSLNHSNALVRLAIMGQNVNELDDDIKDHVIKKLLLRYPLLRESCIAGIDNITIKLKKKEVETLRSIVAEIKTN